MPTSGGGVGGGRGPCRGRRDQEPWGTTDHVSAEGSSDKPHRARPRRRRSPWVATLVVLGVIVVIGVLLWVPVAATSTSDYCGSCKATKPAATAWAQSVHAKVECVECHIPPGLDEQIKWRTKEWLNIWADYLNVPRVDQEGERPGNDNCTPCHDMSTVGDVHGDVKMPHSRHVEISGLVCVDCHDKVSHGTRAQAGRVSMSVCSMCHAQVTATDECGFCHTKPMHPEDTHPPDYIETHGREALADESACLRCHHDPQSFCDDCHSRPTPDHFSGTWRYTHNVVAEKDRQGCMGCHDEAFCAQCHQVSHPADWLQTHQAVAAKGGGSCLTCHPQSMCDACHARSR
jgi:thiol-disulfide isomerase/thioredoxin